MKRNILFLTFVALAAFGATYQVSQQGSSLTVNGTTFPAAAITNSATVLWTVDGSGQIVASATGTNASTVYVTGSAVPSPNFATSTELTPTTTAGTNVSYSLNNNSITTNKVDAAFRALLGGGSGSGNASTNVTQTWPAGNTQLALNDWNFGGSVILSNATVPGTISAGGLSLASPLGFASGGVNATSAAGARTNLSLVPGVDIMAYDAQLQDIAGISFSTGDVIYFDGANLVRKAIGTNGQVLGVSAGALAYINQTGTGGSSTTNLSQLNDTLISAPSANQALIYNGTKWANTTPASNPLLVNWVGAYGIGTRTNFDVSTNVILADFSVPPSASPAFAGRAIEGFCSFLYTNTNSVSANFDFRVIAAGTEVVGSARSLAGVGSCLESASFDLVYESATTASIYIRGLGNTIFPASSGNGIGTFDSTTARQTSLIATNFPWAWASTNSLRIELGLRNTGGGGGSGIGAQRLSAGMYALTDSTLVQPASANLTNVANGASVVMNSLPVTPTGTNLVLDFGFPVLTYSVATNINLIQSTNRPAASTNTVFTLLRLAGDTVDRTLSWNSNWKRLGTNITTIPSNKVVVVSAMVVGTAESGVTFGIAKEE